jgi:DNA-binding beta-propeller fold protein YncE
MLSTLLCAALMLAATPATTSTSAPHFVVEKIDIGGEGGTDYLTAEPGTGRIFISRSTHVMVIDAASGKVLGDIPDTPRVHGIALVPRRRHGFTTNGGDSTVTLFDLATLSVIRKIRVPTGGLDGIMYDSTDDRIVLTNHSRPRGTLVALDPESGDITGTVELEDDAPEGAVSDGHGRIFVNDEGTSRIQVIDARTMKAVATWPLSPCEGPTGIAYDPRTHRIFSACSKTSAILDASTGKIVATVPNGDGVDAIGWDPTERLIYIPAGRDSNVTIVRQEGPNRYRVIATVSTMIGAKTISVDTQRHVAYLFQPRYGPAPSPSPGASPPPPGTRPPRGPVIGAWFFTLRH